MKNYTNIIKLLFMYAYLVNDKRQRTIKFFNELSKCKLTLFQTTLVHCKHTVREHN